MKFFQRSKLPIETLKNIWTVADQPQTSSLDLKKFAVAVRLIQLTQNGQKGKGATLETPPGVVLKPAFFEGVSGTTVQLPPGQQPPQGGMPPPHPTPQQSSRTLASAQSNPGAPPLPGSQPSSPQRRPSGQPSVQSQHQAPPTPSRALVGLDPYTLTPQEQQRYESLFPNYAKTEQDGSQFVYGSEAVPLFMKSGVNPNHLRDIWNMVDRDPVDNRLDKVEFALAMHLIVCVSKKNLPMPQGGALPNSLQALKAGAKGTAAAQSAPPIPQQPEQTQVPPPQPETSMAPPAPGMGMGMGAGGPPPLGGPGTGAMGGMSISDAFEGMNTMDNANDFSQPAPVQEAPAALPSYVPDAPPAAPTPAVQVEPPTPQPQASYVQPPLSTDAAIGQPAPVPEPVPAPVPEATLKPSPSYEVSDTHVEELAKLKEMLFKLQAENVSLKAQLGNMTEEEKNVQQALGQTVTEITALTTDLGNQRKQVLEAKNRLLEAQAELKANKDTKSVLTELISEAKETTTAIESARETLEATSIAQNSAPPPQETTADLFDMGYSNPVGGPLPTAEQSPVPPQQGLDGFANEQAVSNPVELPGGVASMPNPPPQPAGDIVPPNNAPQNEQQLAIPEPVAGDQQQSMMYSNYTAPLPPDNYHTQGQMPPQQEQAAFSRQATAQTTPIQQRPMATEGHRRNVSGFESGFVMGGAAQPIPQETIQENDTFSHISRSVASTGGYGYDEQAYEAVEGLKKKAKTADSAARDAEAAHRKLAAEADELRTDADRAEANARSLSAQARPDEKGKKKRFGGNKKKAKKAMEDLAQAAKDAAQIKSHFMTIQGQALEAQSVAAQMRSEADRLRDQAEAAELKMATAASNNQSQPAPAPPQAQPAPQQAPAYNQMSQPQYGAPPQQAPGGYNQMSQPQYGAPPQQAPGGYNQQPQYGAPPQQAPGGYTTSVDYTPSADAQYGMYAPPPQQMNGAYGQAPPAADPYASPF